MVIHFLPVRFETDPPGIPSSQAHLNHLQCCTVQKTIALATEHRLAIDIDSQAQNERLSAHFSVVTDAAGILGSLSARHS